MAVRGDFSWPSMGNCGVHPWGIPMAACGEFAVAVDRTATSPEIDRPLSRPDEADLGYVRDPYPDFARLRQDSPVIRQEAAFVGGPPSFVVYSHESVTEVTLLRR